MGASRLLAPAFCCSCSSPELRSLSPALDHPASRGLVLCHTRATSFCSISSLFLQRSGRIAAPAHEEEEILHSEFAASVTFVSRGDRRVPTFRSDAGQLPFPASVDRRTDQHKSVADDRFRRTLRGAAHETRAANSIAPRAVRRTALLPEEDSEKLAEDLSERRGFLENILRSSTMVHLVEGGVDGGLDEIPVVEENRESSAASLKESTTEHRAKQSWWMKLYSDSTPRMKGIILLNILTFLYGSNIPVIKEAETLVHPSMFLLGRFSLATLAFLPFILREWTDEEVRTAGIELGLWISMGYLTQGISLLTTDAGRCAFISSFTVIVVPFVAAFFGAKISKLTWGAAGAALIGVGLLESSGSPPTIGDLWSLVSAVLFGIHMLRTEHYSRAVPAEKSLSVIGIQLLVITFCSAAWCILGDSLFGGSPFAVQEMNLVGLKTVLVSLPWLPMIYTGVISTAFCLWIEMSAMRHVSATETAIIYSLEPLWGAAFAWFMLGERWGAQGWLGAIFILVGSVSVQLLGRTYQETIHCPKASELDLKSYNAEHSSKKAKKVWGEMDKINISK